ASAGLRSSLGIAGAAEVISLGASLIANLMLLVLSKLRLKSVLSVPLVAMRTVPPFLTGLALAALLGATQWGLILALAMISFPFEVAVVEEEINASMEMPHIQGAMAIGSPYYIILLRHVGKIAGPRIVRYALLDFVGLVAFEALLGFVGMTRPPAPSIGSEIYNAGPYIATYPWLFLVPGTLLAAGLIAFNAGFSGVLKRR
ncbi:MAG: ABC transporter permease subunit, partial [Deltaproteobacteria bacterium]|nr:ABC transporter permease subunit [Deltaproteobacteria bacterium]